MAQEPQFDVEGALTRPGDVEPLILQDSIPLVESDELEVEVLQPNPMLQLQDIIPEEDEVHEAEAPPGLPVAHEREFPRMDDAAQLQRDLQAFQASDIQLFGRHPQRREFPQAEDMIGFSDADQTDSEDDQENSEPADVTNMNQADSLEPPAEVNIEQNSKSAGTNITTDQNSEPANDINMTGQNSEPAVDNINTDRVSEPAADINFDQDSEPGNMDLDSEPGDTDMDLESDQSAGPLIQEPQMDDRLVAATVEQKLVETLNRRSEVSHELKNEAGAVQSPTQPPIEESYSKECTQLSVPPDHLSRTVAPSPSPSTQIVPSASTLTICQSSLEPNLVTATSPVGDCGQPGAIFNPLAESHID